MYNHEEDTILKFELFLVPLDQGNNIKIKDFLHFVAAVDKIPITGKTIRDILCRSNNFPQNFHMWTYTYAINSY